MPMPVGARLGPYEVVAPLGAGGMGEVYRARDGKLGRDVALKILPETFAGDPERVARFEREARAIAALSHPNILAIHDFSSQDGVTYAVTELLEGETLRHALAGGPLPVRKAVECAVQIANGLAAAHDKGIVHRDLKPENLFLTRDGRLKILDFGLARQQAAPGDEKATQSPTLSRHTDAGVVLGTVGYMSPEQVRGQAADQRSDIFSFGCVLYEMLAGRRAFHRDTTAATLTAILREDPAELPLTIPPGLGRVVLHCLEKRPEQRFQSASDVAFDLGSLTDASTSGPRRATATRPERRFLRVAGWILALGAVAAAIYFVGLRAGELHGTSKVTYTALTLRPQAIFRAAFAPDGKTVVYSAALEGNKPELFTLSPDYPDPRRLDVGTAHLLSVSSKGELAILTEPRYVANRLFVGTLSRVPLSGGSPRPILEGVREADWARDGESLAIIREVDGKDRLEFPIGKVLCETNGYFSDLRFSRNGDHIAFFDHPVKFDDGGSVGVVDLAGGKTVVSASSGLAMLLAKQGLAWSADGAEVLFTAGWYTDSAVYAVTPKGRQRMVLSSPSLFEIHDVSASGRWLCVRQEIRIDMRALAPGAKAERDLSFLDLAWPTALSQDGRRLLFTEASPRLESIYAVRLRRTDGSPPVRLGEGLAYDLSPDGRWALALIWGKQQLVAYPTGPGEPRQLPRGPIESYAWGRWFPDGRRLLVCGSEPAHAVRCYAQDFEGGLPRPVTPEGIAAGLPVAGPAISPDGAQVLASTTTGEFQMYPVDGGSPRPLSFLARTDHPFHWSRDGKSVLVSQDGIPARVERVRLEDGRREPFLTIVPPDLVGVLGLFGISVSEDEASYVYGIWVRRGQAYLVDGAD